MSTCAKCGTPVYFAERRTSLGLDWHPACLTCFECGKRLHPGQHAEHQRRPYCHVPCYSLLFGPTNFLHGVGVATGQESPETRRRMLGKPRSNSSPANHYSHDRDVDSPLDSNLCSNGIPTSSSSCTSTVKVKHKSRIREEGNGNGPKSKAPPRCLNYPLAALSPPSSPSRTRCRKRLYDSELESNLPKDITKDQLFRSILSYNEYFTSPTSSGFLGNRDDGGVGQNWKFLIDYKERNGKFILESLLKIRWGVKRYIQFLEKDEVDPVVWRRSYLARLADSETSMLQLLQKDSYKKRQSFQSVINHSTLSIKANQGGTRCKSLKKEASQITANLSNGPQIKVSLNSSLSSNDNVPSALSMLQNGVDLLTRDDDKGDDGGDRPKAIWKSASHSSSSSSSRSSSSASTPTTSRSPSPAKRSAANGKEAFHRRSRSAKCRPTSSKGRTLSLSMSCHRRLPLENEPTSRSTTSFISSPMISTQNHFDNSSTANFQEEVFHTAKSQFSSSSPILPVAVSGYCVTTNDDALNAQHRTVSNCMTEVRARNGAVYANCGIDSDSESVVISRNDAIRAENGVVSASFAHFKKSAAAVSDSASLITEDEGFETGISEEIFYTAKSDFFSAESNPFALHNWKRGKFDHDNDSGCQRDNFSQSHTDLSSPSQLGTQRRPQSHLHSQFTTKSEMSGQLQFAIQFCSPDKRLSENTSGNFFRGSQSCTSTIKRKCGGGVGGEEDLVRESEKWRQEAERWRKKLEEQTKLRLESPEKVVLRHPRRPKAKKSRLSSINGHIYNPKTRVFTPDFDTISTVRVDNLLTATDVVRILLSKFRIENDPKDFMLYVVKSTGETYPIQDHEYPLYIRLKLGPCHDESQIYIMERNSVETIDAEVAMLMSLPMPVLLRMDEEVCQREAEEDKLIRSRMAEYKKVLLGLLRHR